MSTLYSLPKAHEYWQKPPPQAMWDASADPIHLAVGRALSAWEGMETSFATMFTIFVESDSIAALRTYGVITSVQKRKEALLEVGWIFFQKKGPNAPLSDHLEKYVDHYSRASSFRNNIAHGMVTAVADHYALAPAPYNSMRTTPNELRNDAGSFLRREFGGVHLDVLGDYQYSSQDIDSLRLRFEAVGFAVRHFLFALRRAFH